jgi:hypothetical protein
MVEFRLAGAIATDGVDVIPAMQADKPLRCTSRIISGALR